MPHHPQAGVTQEGLQLGNVGTVLEGAGAELYASASAANRAVMLVY